MMFLMTVCLLLFVVVNIRVEAKIITASIMDNHVNIQIVNNQITIRVTRNDGTYFATRIGANLNLVGETSSKTVNHSTFFALWKNGVQLSVSTVATTDQVKRLNIEWEIKYGVKRHLMECIDMSTHNWYGGGGWNLLSWPLQTTASFNWTPFVPGYGFGEVLESYFLSSAGISYYVHPGVPLFLSVNNTDKTLCFRSEFKFPFRNSNLNPLKLQYTLSISDPSNTTNLKILDGIFLLDSSTLSPSADLVEKPIWSTKFYRKDLVNQSFVVDFVNEIRRYHLPGSVIEIDDGWERCYGEQLFNPVKFPDPKTMIKQIRDAGFGVSLTIHPFVNCECRNLYKEGEREKHFVMVNGYSVNGKVRWENGNCSSLIDVTHQPTCVWWAKKLQHLKNLGIKYFKFDSGKTALLPNKAFLQLEKDFQPGDYFTSLSAFASKFGNKTAINFGYHSQAFTPLILQTSPTDLQLILTSILNFGIIGYNYVGFMLTGDFPPRELYIRWIQLNTFLPVMYFSIAPWNYDDEVIVILKNLMKIRVIVNLVLESAMKETLQYGTPLIRPLWWLNSSDLTAQTITDEFLVGSTYLVAPVLTQNYTERDIYVPEGTWTDMLRGGDILGPKWLYTYQVALEEIPFFIRT